MGGAFSQGGKKFAVQISLLLNFENKNFAEIPKKISTGIKHMEKSKILIRPISNLPFYIANPTLTKLKRKHNFKMQKFYRVAEA